MEQIWNGNLNFRSWTFPPLPSFCSENILKDKSSINPYPCCSNSLSAVRKKNKKILYSEEQILRQQQMSTNEVKETHFQFSVLLSVSVNCQITDSVYVVPNFLIYYSSIFIPIALGNLKQQRHGLIYARFFL